MKSYYTDRSRVIGYQACGRRRFLEYHEAGTGLSPIRKALPLAVGGAVHAGIEVLLRAHIGLATMQDHSMPELEEQAVAAALREFAKYSGAGLELDAIETAAMLPVGSLGAELAKSLGLSPDDPQVLALQKDAGAGQEKFDQYLVEEQSALVEAMVRAYARRRLRPLIEQFEVLEVEREGTWQLAEMGSRPRPGARVDCMDPQHPTPEELEKVMEPGAEIVFMSRPDALLRDRESNQLVILSLKTTAGWDVRKARDAEHDMQGLSEGVEVEQRLMAWWEKTNAEGAVFFKLVEELGDSYTQPIARYLRGLTSAPRIYAIRYEYLLKGDRRTNETLAQEVGVQARVQNSHLIRPYCNPGMTPADAQWCWSYRFKKDDGSGSNLYYKNWKPTPVWRSMSIKAWIDLLDAASETYSGADSTVGLEPRLLGFGNPGCQAVGYTDQHPLDAVFLEPITVFRNDDDLRDWIDQTEAQERRVVEGLVQIESAEPRLYYLYRCMKCKAALQLGSGVVGAKEAQICSCGEPMVPNGTAEVGDPSEKRHLLNVYFPMVRTSCEFPSTCSFVSVCYAASEDVKMRPIESGKFQPRRPNHPIEAGAGKP